ncbi:hypothetical protein ACP5PY_24550 [Photobacterium leiognathi subsp. mandapamensis]
MSILDIMPLLMGITFLQVLQGDHDDETGTTIVLYNTIANTGLKMAGSYIEVDATNNGFVFCIG